MPERRLSQALGPGLLFAGAAVGVSHLVQSTRAGAVFGLSLVGFILLANLIKYPPFSFGPRYAAATGTSLLEGYRRQGRWALVLYGILTLGTMFTVQAAVTLVTAALAKVALGLSASMISLSVILTLLCGVILRGGQYPGLDRIMKVVVAVLTLTTVSATLLALPKLSGPALSVVPDFSGMDRRTLFFLAALIGWMPSAIDVSIWHSLWTLARRRQTGHAPSLRESMLDFNIGYIGTAILAFCFVILGSAVMYGETPAPSAPQFAGQILQLYTATLGEWARPIIGTCALAVMFSTTLTVIDGFPRALATLVSRFQTAESPDEAPTETRKSYWFFVILLAVGSLAILRYTIGSLKFLVDLATTLSFLTAPLLSTLNHRAILSPEVPESFRPGPKLVLSSQISIALQAAFALWFLWLRFLAG